MPDPHWFQLPAVEKLIADSDPSVGQINTMVGRHENLEHCRMVTEAAQRAFDFSVAAALARGVAKRDLAQILAMTEVAVGKAASRAKDLRGT